MKKIAIIGAAKGQLPLCIKAKEMGISTICFAWEKGAICKDYVDKFYSISISEMDKIVDICKKENIDGVVSNASEATAEVVSYVAEKLNKIGIPYKTFIKIQNKEYVRQLTNTISEIGHIKIASGLYSNLLKTFPIPFILKPIKGSAKKGVNFISSKNIPIELSDNIKSEIFIAEQFIEGKEYSIEALSYNGVHDIIQITEKVTTGAPHFVELEHHQPANISQNLKSKIVDCVSRVLSSIGFTYGGSHTEIKIDNKNIIYLIEVNPRGGGDRISDTLISLSTNCDYIKELINICLGQYKPQKIISIGFSGIYFLSEYSKRLLPFFENNYEWIIEKERVNTELSESTSNYDRDGYLIYSNNIKVVL